jgi:hypothetical protein
VRPRFVAVVLVLALLAGALGVTAHAQQDPQPTVGAIQTQIADLETRLTAIAAPAGHPGTPTSDRTVVYEGFTLTFAEYRRSPSIGDVHARGAFVLVFFTAIHDGAERARVPTQEFLLTDQYKTVYTIDDYAMGRLAFTYPTTGTLAPGMEYHLAVAYDVWPDAADLRLVIERAGFSLALDALDYRPPYRPTPTPSGAL